MLSSGMQKADMLDPCEEGEEINLHFVFILKAYPC